MTDLNNYYPSGEGMPSQLQVVIAIVFGFALGWKVFETFVCLGIQRMIEADDDDAVTYDESSKTITLNIEKIEMLSRGLENAKWLDEEG